MGIGIFYSSYNNYSLLEKECLEKIDFEDFEVLNIDDHSHHDEVEKGREICMNYDIPFILNKGKGLQFATETAIEYFSGKPIDWLLCLQQDVKPLGENFFSSLKRYLESKKTSEIGAIGFNVLDDGKYTGEALIQYKNKKDPIGWLGTFPLSDNRTFREKTFFLDRIKFLIKKIIFRRDAFMIHNYRRWFSAKTFKEFDRVSKEYKGLCAIDIPAWPAILINISAWKKHIKPDRKFIFHLWFNDIAFQFMNKNVYVATTTDFYIYNDQKAKTRFGMLESSADEGKLADSKFAEQYGNHLKVFREKWKFSYERIKDEFDKVEHLYVGTIIHDLMKHDCTNGPIKKFNQREEDFEDNS